MLAIDPGMTTGVAVLNSSGEVILGTEMRGDPHLIVATLKEIQHEDVVVEEGLPTRDNAYLDDLDAQLRETFPDATWVRPSEWKGTPRSHLALPRRIKSPHVKDAARMGREHLHQTGHSLDV